MNKNYSYTHNNMGEYFDPNILIYDFAFDLEKFISKNWKNLFFYQKFVHLCENTFPYCSLIIVVHVYEHVFL